MNDFPLEIIQEIFLCSLPPFEPADPSCRRSLASPSLISSVCRKWRDIALNFPSMWTHLHVVDPASVNVVPTLKKWMERAGDLPLFLSIYQGLFANEEACIAVVKLFLHSLHRCKSLTMRLRTDLQYFKIRDFERQPSTCLESVEVWSKSYLWADADQLTNLLFTSRTSLRSINTNVMRSLPVVSRSWGNLRELVSAVDDVSEFFDALSCCPNLEYLKVYGLAYEQSRTPVSVTLRQLTRLSIHPSGLLGRSLIKLTLPSLTNLELLSGGDLEWAPVLELLQRSRVMLRRLGISSESFPRQTRVDEVGLIEHLQKPLFKELTELEVEEPVGFDIVKFLTVSQNRGGLGQGDADEKGYLLHLQKLSLVFKGLKPTMIKPDLKKLIGSRLGITTRSVSQYLDILEHDEIRFSLSIPKH